MRLKTKHIAVLLVVGLFSVFWLGKISSSQTQIQANETPHETADETVMDAQILNDRITQLAQTYVPQREQVALVIGVPQKGKTHIAGFGKFSDANSTPPNANTIYEIGSITKLFTGITLAKLANEGAVDLDAPITQYLPSTVTVAPEAQKITLRQLATHTSGLPRLPGNFEKYVTDEANPYVNYTAEALYEELAQVQLVTLPLQ